VSWHGCLMLKFYSSKWLQRLTCLFVSGMRFQNQSDSSFWLLGKRVATRFRKWRGADGDERVDEGHPQIVEKRVLAEGKEKRGEDFTTHLQKLQTEIANQSIQLLAVNKRFQSPIWSLKCSSSSHEKLLRQPYSLSLSGSP